MFNRHCPFKVCLLAFEVEALKCPVGTDNNPITGNFTSCNGKDDSCEVLFS